MADHSETEQQRREQDIWALHAAVARHERRAALTQKRYSATGLSPAEDAELQGLYSTLVQERAQP